MESIAIIELDVLHDPYNGFDITLEMLLMNKSRLQRMEEGLYHRIIQWVSLPAHAARISAVLSTSL